MLKIRLMRIGAKKRPFYRVVVVDERAKRTGGYIELLGTYNPLTEPKDIKLKQDRIDHWTKQGAQMSTGFLRIIGKAPQRKPRKPKKQKQESSDMNKAGEQKTKEKIEEETPKEEASIERGTTNVIPTPSEAEGEGSSTLSDSPTTEDSSPAEPVQNDNTEIATEPTAPRNDEIKESEKKDEGSA